LKKLGIVRIGVYSHVALALAGALRFTPRLPDTDAKPADVMITQAATPAWKLRYDTLESGESLAKLLQRDGMSDESASHALRAATEDATLDPRRIPAGMPVTMKSAAADSEPSEVTLQLAIDRVVRLTRTGDTWTGKEVRLPWTTDTIIVAGTITSNLYDAIDASAPTLPASARQQLTWTIADDVYQYRIDMSRDLQPGDAFRVAAERSVAPNGAVRIGKVIASKFTLSGKTITAVHFASKESSGEYYDQDGRSMRSAFLRAPLSFRRISSVFGMREHPILGIVRAHKGTDYAAAAGTPVRAIGDGVVVRKGWSNGYGNLLEIRHRNGFHSRYGHLSRFATGIQVGSRVTQAETIAYVGSTGLATGPHLHFEILVDGVQRDPKKILAQISGDPITKSERAAFDSVRDMLLGELGQPVNGVTKLASR
jgi:murein DD-endopeptidase MepM/ murein hydrolase activator NlpD